MKENEHYVRLTKMYKAARINDRVFINSEMMLGKGTCELSLPLRPEYHHALNALHGAVYFKLLDDSAFFAAQTMESEYFIVTSSFNIQLIRPVVEGTVIAVGTVRNRSRNLLIAESRLMDERGREIAFGTGNFMKSSNRLTDADGYGVID